MTTLPHKALANSPPSPSLVSEYIVEVSSRQRQNQNGETDTRFSFKVDYPRNPRGYELNRVVVTSATVNKTWYLVMEDQNTFQISENGVARTITVPPGSYSRSRWCLAIPALLTAESKAAGNNWTYTAIPVSSVNTSPENGYITISVTGNGGVQPSLILGEHLYRQFGLEKNSTNAFSSSSLTSISACNFDGFSALKLKSNIVHPNCGTDTLAFLGSIGSTASFAVVTHQAQNPLLNSRPLNDLNSSVFTFQLCSAEDDRHVDLNGEALVFEIKIYREEDQHVNMLRILSDSLERSNKFLQLLAAQFELKNKEEKELFNSASSSPYVKPIEHGITTMPFSNSAIPFSRNESDFKTQPSIFNTLSNETSPVLIPMPDDPRPFRPLTLDSIQSPIKILAEPSIQQREEQESSEPVMQESPKKEEERSLAPNEPRREEVSNVSVENSTVVAEPSIQQKEESSDEWENISNKS